MDKFDGHVFCGLCGCQVPANIICSDSDCPVLDDLEDEEEISVRDKDPRPLNFNERRREYDDTPWADEAVVTYDD